MVAQLSRKTIIERRVLDRLVQTRLRESRVLLKGRCYGGAVYMAGYAVECCLKVAICTALDWSHLRATFMSHDLELLLMHTGLEQRLTRETEVRNSFAKIQGIWTMTGEKAIRYRSPGDFKAADARSFLRWVSHRDIGVVPWLRKRIS
ncbi:MAG: hypothetical protein ACE5GE_15290 [Phycisphaerae bacterium]